MLFAWTDPLKWPTRLSFATFLQNNNAYNRMPLGDFIFKLSFQKQTLLNGGALTKWAGAAKKHTWVNSRNWRQMLEDPKELCAWPPPVHAHCCRQASHIVCATKKTAAQCQLTHRLLMWENGRLIYVNGRDVQRVNRCRCATRQSVGQHLYSDVAIKTKQHVRKHNKPERCMLWRNSWAVWGPAGTLEQSSTEELGDWPQLTGDTTPTESETDHCAAV